MEDMPLSPELLRIEKELAARPRGEPSEQSRARCLDGLQAELRRQRAGSRWPFAVAIAASVLLGLNLSLSATQATDFGFRRSTQHLSSEKLAGEIRELLPDLSSEEAMRQAMLMRTASSLVPCPKVPAISARGGEIRELPRL